MSERTNMKRNYYIVVLIFLTFFVISFITNILGALNPDVIQSFSLSLTLAGLLPFAFFIAYGVLSIPAGMLVEKYKERAIMVAAFIVAFAGATLFSLFPHYLVFLISLFLMGAGMAMLQVAINPLLRVSGGEEHYAFNSVLAQLIFGGASFLAPLFLTYLITSLSARSGQNAVKSIFSGLVPPSLHWTSLYWVFALIFLAMVVIIWLSKFPAVERKEDEIAGTWETHKNLFKRKTVRLFFIGIFAYVGTEQGVSYWLSKFLQTYHGVNPLVGADIVGGFWGWMAVGGVLGLVLLKFFDSRRVLVGAVILAVTFLSIALFGTTNMSKFAFQGVGFALSVQWPIVFSLAMNSLESHHGSFSGILVTGIIGGAIIQVVIGWLGDTFGLRTGMFLIYLTLAYIFSVGIWAKPLITNETISMKKKMKKEMATAK